MSSEVIANMRARVAQYRRLANSINDPEATESLLRMARDIQADLQRSEADALDGAGTAIG